MQLLFLVCSNVKILTMLNVNLHIQLTTDYLINTNWVVQHQ